MCVCVCVHVCGVWRDARDTGCVYVRVCVCVCARAHACARVCGVCFLFSQVLGLRVYVASVETVSSG